MDFDKTYLRRIQKLSDKDLACGFIAPKLMTEANTIKFFLANFVNSYITDGSIPGHISELNNADAFRVWKTWEGRLERLPYLIHQEIKSSGKTIQELTHLDDPYRHPPIIGLCLSKKMSLETFAVIVNACPSVIDDWQKISKDDVFLPGYIGFIKAYAPFVKRFS